MKEIICIVCPNGCHLRVDEENGYQVSGNRCPKGAEYGREELLHPVRVLTGTVRLRGGVIARCPVKSLGAIPKGVILDAARALREVEISAPIRRGEIVVKDICGTGVDVAATREIPPMPPPAAGGDVPI